MRGPNLTPSEAVEIARRTYDRYRALGHDRDAAINITASKFNIDAYKLEAFIHDDEIAGGAPVVVPDTIPETWTDASRCPDTLPESWNA